MTLMRIAMLAYHSDPYAPLGGFKVGGMNVYLRNLSAALAAKGHQIDLYTRAWADEYPLLDLPEGVVLERIAAGPAKALSSSDLIAYLPEFTEQMNLLEERYDLIHAHYWMSGLAAMQLKEAWQRPFVTTMHTLGLLKERVAREPESLIDKRILSERKLLEAANHVTASTVAEQAELQWLYEVSGRKISVIAPGVDTHLFGPMDQNEARQQLGLNQKGPYLLFTGRMDPVKGLDVLLEALSLLEDQEPRLLVVGGEQQGDAQSVDSLHQELVQQVARLGLEERVHFLGRKTQAELSKYYNAADLVVLPSHYESFGLVALEAMACGRPVLASKVGGLADFVDPELNGLLVPPGDPAALAEQITRLLSDSDMAAALGARARKFAKDRNWRACASAMEMVYKQVINQNVD